MANFFDRGFRIIRRALAFVSRQILSTFAAPKALDLEADDANERHQPLALFHAIKPILLAEDNYIPLSLALILTVLKTFFSFLSAYMFGQLLEYYSKPANTDLSEEQDNGVVIMAVFVLSAMLSQVLPSLRDKALAQVSANSTRVVLQKVTQRIIAEKSLQYHTKTPASDISYFLQKSFSVPELMTPLLTQVIPTMLEMCLAVILLSSQGGFAISVGLVLTLAAHTRYALITTQETMDLRQQFIERSGEAWRTMDGALKQYKQIHDFNRYKTVKKEIAGVTQAAADTQVAVANTVAKLSVGHILISYVAFFIALLYLGRGMASGRYPEQASIMMIGYFKQVASLLPNFGSAVTNVITAYPDLKFVFDALAQAPEVVDGYPDVALDAKQPSIHFKDIVFSYPRDKTTDAANPIILNHLSLNLTAGEMTALVSESGGGKSTLFHLLYRYYQPTQGTISINEQDINCVSMASLRQAIAMVGQNPGLIHGSVGDNIRYGANTAQTITDEEIKRLATRLGLDGFIEQLANGLDTSVGQEGKELSGGQQQKVAILRALIIPSSILLLDEITAALDSDSASKVLAGIRSLTKERNTTTLMITHKLTEAQDADRVVVIQRGQVVGDGTHQALLSESGCSLYARLWHQYQKTGAEQSVDVAPLASGHVTFKF